ncbi:MAG TPA: LptF/LptG family permease, partial [Tepidisphaeraceae bacterium]
MSRTLFVYIFKDLVRIFLLALLSLAVIMSFGGLMRPLTRQGLQPTQIGAALLYLLPAMMTYALPIAALFGTTFVYGRLSADNEITACRAGGISYFSMVTPALLLGLIVSIVSLLMLCFIVPGLTLRVEQLATSNLARWIAFEIERDHQVKRNDWPYTIFAQSAYLPDQAAGAGDKQVVVLKGPMIVTYDRSQVLQSKNASAVHIPKNFWMAREATVFIENKPGDKVELSGHATNGTMFDRVMHGDRGGTSDATFGPMDISVGVREHPKFMDIVQLKNLLADRSQSQRLQDSFASLIRHDQEQTCLASI